MLDFLKPEKPESALEVTAKGALAGLAGTVVLSVLMDQGPRIMEQLGLAPEETKGQGENRKVRKTGIGTQPKGEEEPTEKLAEKVAEGVFDEELSDDAKKVAGQAIHWGYGAAWGAFYGIVQSSLRLPYLLHGTLFGGLITLVSVTLMPSLKIAAPPGEQTTRQNVISLVVHMAYAWTTALVFRLISRSR